MSNKLTEMAREILAIEADLPYRFDYGVIRCDVCGEEFVFSHLG